MEANDLSEYGQYEGGGHERKHETDERYGKARICNAIEGLSESRASGSFSEVDFRPDSRAHVAGRSKEHEEVRDVLVRNRPHPLYSELFRVSSDGKGKEISVTLVGYVNILSCEQRFFRIALSLEQGALHSRGSFEKFRGPFRSDYYVIGLFDVFSEFFQKR